MEDKRTLVLGASLKEDRYSNRAVRLLERYGHDVYAYGLRAGKIDEREVVLDWPQDIDIHTVTMYVGSQNQAPYYDKIIALNPKRVVFNPGTENADFADRLRDNGVEVVEHCTLVMLNNELY